MLYPNGQITPVACINLLVCKICHTLFHQVFSKVYAVWTALEQEGLGCNLQHYNFSTTFNQDIQEA